MMLMTPLTALAPQSAPPGPRMTSIRSMSARRVSWTSQKVPANSGEYRAAAVEHDEQLVGRADREASRAHRPSSPVIAGHVETVGEPHGLGERDDAGPANVILPQHRNSRCCLREALDPPRNGSDVELGQFLDGETLQILCRHIDVALRAEIDRARENQRNRNEEGTAEVNPGATHPFAVYGVSAACPRGERHSTRNCVNSCSRAARRNSRR